MGGTATHEQPAGTPSLAAQLDAAGYGDAALIGRGSFGAIFRCTQRSLGRMVAVKVLAADLDPDNRERFVREGLVMGRLSEHPYILSVIEVGMTSSGRPYIVMAYCAQDSLAARLRRTLALARRSAARARSPSSLSNSTRTAARRRSRSVRRASAVERSRARFAAALADGGADQLVHTAWADGRQISLRRLLCDLIEEYGRHTGHADLLREAIDGVVGE